MARKKLLVIDDEDDIRMLLKRILKLEGYEVATASSGREGLQQVTKNNYHVIICDVRLPDADGVELTRRIKEVRPASEVIQLTAHGNITDGVRAIQNGAFNYIIKGDDNNQIIPLVARAAEKAQAQRRVQRIDEKNRKKYGFDQIIGSSDAINQAKNLARQVAPTDTSVLITGATGTGKEVFAHAIHYASARKDEPFVAINCAAFGRELLESEMFGHTAQAFTGATKAKKGLFEVADGGTIFLDELGEMDLALQAKLLRVLENGTFMRVGSTEETRVNVRVIAATNRDLLAEADRGSFRLDLYYRLSTFTINLPGLNERGEDIIQLARLFIESIGSGMNSPVEGMDRNFEQALLQHRWRGNVRELRNFIERALILSKNKLLGTPDLPADFVTERNPENVASGENNALDNTPALSLAEVERIHIQRVMRMTGGNKSRAAELLGIGLTTLYRKLEEYK